MRCQEIFVGTICKQVFINLSLYSKLCNIITWPQNKNNIQYVLLFLIDEQESGHALIEHVFYRVIYVISFYIAIKLGIQKTNYAYLHIQVLEIKHKN